LPFAGKAAIISGKSNRNFYMGKGNHAHKKEVKKPKKEKPKVLATRKSS